MRKVKYMAPELEVILFNTEDVVTASGDDIPELPLDPVKPNNIVGLDDLQ